MSSKHLSSFTRGDSRLASLTDRAHAILQLDKAFKRILPGTLGSFCQVACVREGELVVYAHNGTVAARLRLLGNSLLQPLLKQGYPLKSVRIKVMPVVPRREHQKSFQLSEAGLEAFAQSLEKLRVPEVRAAVEALLARRNK